jgi:subtilisin family serine protease
MILSRARGLLVGLLIAWAAASTAAAAQPRPQASDPAAQVLVFMRAPPEHFRPNAAYGGAYGGGADHSARFRIASRLARAHGASMVGDWPIPLIGMDCFVLAARDAHAAAELAQALSHAPEVAWAEPVAIYRAKGAPAAAHNDPLFRVQPAAREWRLAELHEIATGRNVRVAVVDSLVDVAHPDLTGQVATREDFAPRPARGAELHGTGVAGVIAARADNGLGITGVAPRAKLMALRACWQEPGPAQGAPETLCDNLSLAKALHFAIAHDAQVINLSLGGLPDPLLDKLLDVALARGIVVVAAYDRSLPGGGFPASHPGVVAVADEGGQTPAGVFQAPGRDVPTTQPGGRWFLVNGSSYSAAHVSGLFALLKEKDRSAKRAAAGHDQRRRRDRRLRHPGAGDRRRLHAQGGPAPGRGTLRRSETRR